MLDPFERAGITDGKVKKVLLDAWRAYGVVSGMGGVRALDALIAFYVSCCMPGPAELAEACKNIFQEPTTKEQR